jgi:DNA-binding CsgD family transcriptional regulator
LAWVFGSGPGRGPGAKGVSDQLERDLIGQLYDAAMGKLPWQDVGAGIAKLLQGTTLLMFEIDLHGKDVDLITNHDLPLEHLHTYVTEFAQYDPWTTAAFGNRYFNRPLIGSQIVPDAELERSLFWNEFIRPAGITAFRFLGAMRQLPEGGFAILSSHRPRDAVDFGATQQRRMARLLPHFGRAVEMRRRLQPARVPNGSTVLVERLAQGVIQLGPLGEFLQANAAAEEILRESDGLFRSSDGIHAASAAENKRLRYLIGEAAKVTTARAGSPMPGGYISISRPSCRLPYRCLVAPLGLDRVIATPRHPSVLLFVVDPENPVTVEPKVLQDLFDLTPAEARVTGGLAMGASLPAVATRLGISVNTARTLLARATSKTQTNSQLELVRTVLATLPGGLRS